MSHNLATVEGAVSDLQFAIRTTALAGHDVAGKTFDETLLRVRDGVLDTPAGTTAHLPAVYTTFTDDFLERIEVTGPGAVRALVNLLDLQVWLAMLPETAQVEMRFDGDPDRGVADELVIDARDERVTLDGSSDVDEFADISIEMPMAFESGRFHFADDTAAPTVARTSGETLERIVDTVEVAGAETYPVHIDDEGLQLDIEAEGVRVEASLPGTLMEGEPVANDYNDGFAAMARTLSGKIRIETGPGEPAAFVTEGQGYTLRVILEQG